MKKTFFDDIKELFHAIFPWVVTIALVVLVYYIAYQVAISDLPPWFKFFLLRAK